MFMCIVMNMTKAFPDVRVLGGSLGSLVAMHVSLSLSLYIYIYI